MTRREPPYAADEREMLIAHLDYERESVVMKLDGLTEEQGRRAPSTGGNSLMALVKHLGYVENWWFRVCFNGEADAYLYPEDDLDADFRVTNSDTIPDLIAFYRAEWAISNRIVRAAPSLDQEAKYTKRTDGVPTLRWILNHMLEETARHAGHADITRELIDGSVGM
jgi:uncharacterized damage-inducible protein DinB